jgi:hypothetical protein
MWKRFLELIKFPNPPVKIEPPVIPPRELRNFKHFPLNENKSGWIVSETDKLLIIQLEDCLDKNTRGGYSTTELAIAVLEHLTDTKWTPPKIEITKQ